MNAGFTDKLGNLIFEGAIVAYATSQGRSAVQRVGRVIGLGVRKNTIKVESVDGISLKKDGVAVSRYPEKVIVIYTDPRLEK